MRHFVEFKKRAKKRRKVYLLRFPFPLPSIPDTAPSHFYTLLLNWSASIDNNSFSKFNLNYCVPLHVHSHENQVLLLLWYNWREEWQKKRKKEREKERKREREEERWREGGRRGGRRIYFFAHFENCIFVFLMPYCLVKLGWCIQISLWTQIAHLLTIVLAKINNSMRPWLTRPFARYVIWLSPQNVS